MRNATRWDYHSLSLGRGRGRRWLATAVTAPLLVVALAGCGGSQVAGGEPALTSLLSEIPSNSTTDARIVINDLQALKAAAGLPATIGSAQLGAPRNMHRLATLGQELADGTPLGSEMLVGSSAGVQVGYDPMSVSAELGVGDEPDSLSVVDGTFNTAAVGRALAKYGWIRRVVGSTAIYSGPENLGSASAVPLHSMRQIAISGHRLVGASAGVPPSELANVLQRHTNGHSLADDPLVAQALRLLGPGESVVLGSGLILSTGTQLGPSATPAARHELATRLGLEGLPQAVFGGYALLDHGAWKAVVLYPSNQDATRAAPIIARIFRDGISPKSNEPYAKFAHPTSITANGRAVVVRLTPFSHVPLLIVEADFPPFFSPVA
jgi:hypothetical protein